MSDTTEKGPNLVWSKRANTYVLSKSTSDQEAEQTTEGIQNDICLGRQL